MPRFALIAAAVLSTALVTIPSVKSSETQKPVEFVSGTVTSIPVRTAGTLDTASHVDLQFHYSGTVFSVPYQKITSTETADPSGWHIWRVPIPKLGRSTRLLTISYRKVDDSTATVTFKASAGIVSSLVDVIDERREPTPDPASLKTREAAAAKLADEEWWGNRYWRTQRNKGKWPQPSDSQGAPSGTGTKE
jgi:hypothetical protein